MKKILCPTDFSDTAHAATAYAAKLAQATNCELVLLNVQSLFDFSVEELFQGKRVTIEVAASQLEAQAQQIAKSFHISCYAEVEPTFRRLSSIIQEKSGQYDLIVMGTDGPDDLFQLMGGSNTYNAILRTQIPMLIIPAGFVYSEIRSMVLAFDYLRERSLPLTLLSRFVKALKCKLTVLQVQEAAFSQVAEEDLQGLQVVFRNIYDDDLTFSYDAVHSDQVAQSINSYMLQNQVDVLAVCSVHRNLIERLFHKSVIRELSAISRYPIYVFHQ
jgi:nucleotide-binding universal stress UspA family protein